MARTPPQLAPPEPLPALNFKAAKTKGRPRKPVAAKQAVKRGQPIKGALLYQKYWKKWLNRNRVRAHREKEKLAKEEAAKATVSALLQDVLEYARLYTKAGRYPLSAILVSYNWYYKPRTVYNT